MADKALLYEQFARTGKALANPARLLLLELLAQGERAVDELATAAGMRVSNVSAQLHALAAAGLVAVRRAGTRAYYRIVDDEVAEFVEQLKDLARSHAAETERTARDYLGDVAGLEPVGLDELARRMAAGEVTVLDVRPEAEYAAGHVPGAVNVPPGRVAEMAASLPPGHEIVAYCRGRYCVLALDAVRLLRDRGLQARPLDGGLPEWRRAGGPVATGTE